MRDLSTVDEIRSTAGSRHPRLPGLLCVRQAGAPSDCEIPCGTSCTKLRQWRLLHECLPQDMCISRALGLTAAEQALVEHAWQEAEHLAFTEEVAMVLTISAFGLDLANYQEVQHLMWDLTTEPDYEWQKLTFPRRPMWYTNTSYDLKRLSAEQVSGLVARAAFPPFLCERQLSVT